MARRRIMGIDPGTNRMGYGFLDVDGDRLTCPVMGIIELHAMKDPYQKLRHIFERVSQLVREYAPDEVALEAPFFGKNVQSMLKLGRAQGVAMAAALSMDRQVFEYAPRRVKQAITGNGDAAKLSVAAMLQKITGIEYSPDDLDATDGLAVALCHHLQSSSPLFGQSRTAPRRKSSGATWEAFAAQNPDKISDGRRPSADSTQQTNR